MVLLTDFVQWWELVTQSVRPLFVCLVLENEIFREGSWEGNMDIKWVKRGKTGACKNGPNPHKDRLEATLVSLQSSLRCQWQGILQDKAMPSCGGRHSPGPEMKEAEGGFPAQGSTSPALPTTEGKWHHVWAATAPRALNWPFQPKITWQLLFHLPSLMRVSVGHTHLELCRAGNYGKHSSSFAKLTQYKSCWDEMSGIFLRIIQEGVNLAALTTN